MIRCIWPLILGSIPKFSSVNPPPLPIHPLFLYTYPPLRPPLTHFLLHRQGIPSLCPQMLHNDMPLIPGLSSFSTFPRPENQQTILNSPAKAPQSLSQTIPIHSGSLPATPSSSSTLQMGLLGTPSVLEGRKQGRGATKSFSFVFGMDSKAALNSPKEEAKCRKVLTFSQFGRIEELETAVGKEDSSFSTPKKEHSFYGTSNRESLFNSTNREKAFHSSTRQHSFENSLNGASHSQNSLDNVFNPPHHARNYLNFAQDVHSPLPLTHTNYPHTRHNVLYSSAPPKQPSPAAANITIKKISKAQAVFRKVKSEFSQSSPISIPANKITKAREPSFANSSPNPHSVRYQRDLASVLDELESELFSTPDFSSNSTAGDQIMRDSFEDPFSFTPPKVEIQPLAAASAQKDKEYIHFLTSLKSPLSQMMLQSESEEEDEAEIYQESGSSSSDEEAAPEDSEREEEKDLKGKKPLHSNHANAANHHLKFISERELTELYGETLHHEQQQQPEGRIRTSPHIPKSMLLQWETHNSSQEQVFSTQQLDEIGAQLKQHFQILIQNISLLMETKCFDGMLCVKGQLQTLFEFSHYNQVYKGTGKLNAFQPVTGIGKLIDFYRILQHFNPDISFTFKRPPLQRGIPDKYPATKELLYSRMDTTQLFIPPILQRVLVLFQREFDADLMLSWDAAKSVNSAAKNAIYATSNAAINANTGTKEVLSFYCDQTSKCRFLETEDELLLIGLKRFCLNWERIQNRLLPSKTARQIAIRYKNLTTRRAPANAIKEFHINLAKPLTEQEEDLLYAGVHRHGRDFAKISQLYLPYRPAAFLRKLWLELDESRRKLMIVEAQKETEANAAEEEKKFDIFELAKEFLHMD